MKWIPLLLILTLTACSGGRAVAPVGSYGSAGSQRAVTTPPSEYTVKKGDTLYSISWRYGMDYRDVARINGIGPPYTIYVGQKIRFRGAPAPVRTTGSTATRTPQPATASRPAPTRSSSSNATIAAKPATQPSASTTSASTPTFTGNQNLSWRWPTQGTLLSTYSESSPGRKGIKIGGRPGQDVVAAAGGKVVYSGNGLTRYGNLLIIKHNDVYLSAYAHNDRLLVSEGDVVAGGQKIATLGRTGTQQDQLHFEIRRNGKPVDPLRFLPKR